MKIPVVRKRKKRKRKIRDRHFKFKQLFITIYI